MKSKKNIYSIFRLTGRVERNYERYGLVNQTEIPGNYWKHKNPEKYTQHGNNCLSVTFPEINTLKQVLIIISAVQWVSLLAKVVYDYIHYSTTQPCTHFTAVNEMQVTHVF
jgi:hypothetical protein